MRHVTWVPFTPLYNPNPPSEDDWASRLRSHDTSRDYTCVDFVLCSTLNATRTATKCIDQLCLHLVVNMATSSLVQLLLLCSQCLPVIAQLQFISYNGSITGNLQPGASAPSSCQSYYLPPIGNATFQVGVNPPWDINPFYFAFYAAGNVAANLPALECGSGLCTYDSIWDLGFITAEDKCIVNATGDECNGFYSSGQIYYLPIEALNLNEAKIAPIQLAGANGYSVTGDQSTAGNLTVNNGFSFQQPHNYTLAGVNPCFWDQLYFYWYVGPFDLYTHRPKYPQEFLNSIHIRPELHKQYCFRPVHSHGPLWHSFDILLGLPCR